MANEANPPDPASAAPAAVVAPQATPPDSPPAVAPAVATPEPAAVVAPEAAAPAAEAKAPEAQLTLLQQFDKENAPKPADAKPEGDKLAGDPVKPEGEADKPKPDGDKPAEPKPGEAKPAEAKPAEAKPAEAPKVEPVAYEYALPESIKMDDALKGEFHTALDEFRADPTKGAQGLIALHERTMTEYATSLQEQMAQHQRDVWNDTRKTWNTNVLASEEIGGSGHQTAMAAIARMRDLFVPEAKRAAFEQFLEVTGAGDHPAFLEMLHQAARMFDEPPMPPPNVKPSPTNGQNPNARRGIIYDHPRSAGNRQQ